MKNTKSLTYLLSVLALASAVFATDADRGARAGPAASASASASASAAEPDADITNRVYYMPTYGEAPKFDTEGASIPTPGYPTPTLLWGNAFCHPGSEHPAVKPLGRPYLELCRAPRAPKGTGRSVYVWAEGEPFETITSESGRWIDLKSGFIAIGVRDDDLIRVADEEGVCFGDVSALPQGALALAIVRSLFMWVATPGVPATRPGITTHELIEALMLTPGPRDPLSDEFMTSRSFSGNLGLMLGKMLALRARTGRSLSFGGYDTPDLTPAMLPSHLKPYRARAKAFLNEQFRDVAEGSDAVRFVRFLLSGRSPFAIDREQLFARNFFSGLTAPYTDIRDVRRLTPDLCAQSIVAQELYDAGVYALPNITRDNAPYLHVHSSVLRELCNAGIDILPRTKSFLANLMGFPIGLRAPSIVYAEHILRAAALAGYDVHNLYAHDPTGTPEWVAKILERIPNVHERHDLTRWRRAARARLVAGKTVFGARVTAEAAGGDEPAAGGAGE